MLMYGLHTHVHAHTSIYIPAHNLVYINTQPYREVGDEEREWRVSERHI